MRELYLFLMHFSSGFIMVLFHFKITTGKVKPQKMAIIFLYALYMMLAHGTIIEPFRAMVGLLILFFAIKNKEQKPILAALLIPFLTFPIIRTVLSIALGIPSYLLLAQHMSQDLAALIVLLPFEVMVFTILYRRIKVEKIRDAISEKEIKAIIYISTLVIWIIYGLAQTLGMLNDDISRAITITLIIILIPSGLVSIFFILYSVKKYHDRKKLEEKIVSREQLFSNLEVQVGKVEEKRNQLEKEKVLLQTTVDELISEKHYYKTVMLANDLTLMKFDDELNRVLRGKNVQGLNSLTRVFSSFKNFSTELGTDFSLQELQTDIKEINTPEEWGSLRLILGRFVYEARENNIHLSVENDVTNFHEIEMSEVTFVRLIGNLISNALKELKKTLTKNKYVRVKLEYNDGVFIVEVIDNAYEFSLKVLRRLGERKNSTNGTGDGYWEIFEILNGYNASFKIDELMIRGFPYKRIRIIFDGFGRKHISSTYRKDLLLVELEASILEVT